jgi:hypothetical protein
MDNFRNLLQVEEGTLAMSPLCTSDPSLAPVLKVSSILEILIVINPYLLDLGRPYSPASTKILGIGKAERSTKLFHDNHATRYHRLDIV